MLSKNKKYCILAQLSDVQTNGEFLKHPVYSYTNLLKINHFRFTLITATTYSIEKNKKKKKTTISQTEQK